MSFRAPSFFVESPSYFFIPLFFLKKRETWGNNEGNGEEARPKTTISSSKLLNMKISVFQGDFLFSSIKISIFPTQNVNRPPSRTVLHVGISSLICAERLKIASPPKRRRCGGILPARASGARAHPGASRRPVIWRHGMPAETGPDQISVPRLIHARLFTAAVVRLRVFYCRHWPAAVDAGRARGGNSWTPVSVASIIPTEEALGTLV